MKKTAPPKPSMPRIILLSHALQLCEGLLCNDQKPDVIDGSIVHRWRSLGQNHEMRIGIPDGFDVAFNPVNREWYFGPAEDIAPLKHLSDQFDNLKADIGAAFIHRINGVEFPAEPKAKGKAVAS